MKYEGSCHCGRVAFEVEGEVDGALACNCSMCGRRGSLLWFVPREQLALKTAEADVGTYTFHRHVIRHHFCPACGIHTWGEAKDPQGRSMAAVNLRVIAGVDLEALPVQHYDGRAL